MLPNQLPARLRVLCSQKVPAPGRGKTPERHLRLYEVGREDLSLAKLAEAHWDAQSILEEAGREPVPGALYAVWASELPGRPVEALSAPGGWRLSGTKHFASGATLVDRALVTVQADGPLLVDVDLRRNAQGIRFDGTGWQTPAFEGTSTGAVMFTDVPIQVEDVVGAAGFYLERAGFWPGACGPAACWAGGAAGLLEHALLSRREDAHTLAHLAGMHSDVWALKSMITAAGEELDRLGENRAAAHRLALTFRHIVEQLSTDVLRRFARAYGPQPLSMNAEVSRRYFELDLFLRQAHAERDLEVLGRALRGL